tara:strand:+ start:38 stop:352 length:315 start_codon:yes stop_codon:yes gene_type:complete
VGSKRETDSSTDSSERDERSELKVTVFSWSDEERWSADEETLKSINKMIRMSNKEDKYFNESSLDVVGNFLSDIFWRGIYLAKQICNRIKPPKTPRPDDPGGQV